MYLERVQELAEVTERRDKFRSALLSTTAQRLSEFMKGVAIISFKLKEMFRMISIGGDAKLDLVDSNDPFSSGIEFWSVPSPCPPTKLPLSFLPIKADFPINFCWALLGRMNLT